MWLRGERLAVNSSHHVAWAGPIQRYHNTNARLNDSPGGGATSPAGAGYPAALLLANRLRGHHRRLGHAGRSYGVEISFARWMLVGLPLVAVLLPLAWWVLTRVWPGVPAGESATVRGRDLVAREARALGAWSRPQRRVAIVFVATAGAWVTGPVWRDLLPGDGLSDAGVAVVAGVTLLTWPAGEAAGDAAGDAAGEAAGDAAGDAAGEARRWRPLLTWDEAVKIPWGVLILFGGGLSLADAMESTGLAQAIGDQLAGLAATLVVLVVLVAVTALLLSEFASNTATAAAFLPVAAAMAIASDLPAIALAAPVAIAASGGCMLPVATPPNAVVFGSGLVSVPTMMQAGALLDLAFVLAASVAAFTLVPWWLG